MEIIKTAAIILICIVIISSFSIIEKPIATLITVLTCVLVLIYIIDIFSPVVLKLKYMAETSDIGDFSIIFKATGINLITQFVSDVATDTGNKTLANQMIFAGKAAIIILSLPVFGQVLNIIGSLIL